MRHLQITILALISVIGLSSCASSEPVQSGVDIAIFDSDVSLENETRSLGGGGEQSPAAEVQVEPALSQSMPVMTLPNSGLDQSFDESAAQIAETIKGQKRVALIVGNASYQHLSPLRNPVNDAKSLARTLEARNFEVLLAIDQTKVDLDNIVREFSAKADGADLALYFYSGHGMQMDDRNWMLPVDAKNISQKADMSIQASPMDVVFDQMTSRAKTSLIFLDACRDNPFVERLARSSTSHSRTRSASSGSKGLARVESLNGDAYVAFATAPGEVAFDGFGQYSPFTEALLRHLQDPVVELEALMRGVRKDVIEATKNEEIQQVPWGNSALTEVVYL